MPTYDYECKYCTNAFEHFQAIHAPKLRKCPSCGRHGLQRLIGSGGGIVFKGSGFYETDYRSKSYKASAQKAASAVKEAKDSGGDGTSKAGKTGGKSPARKTAAGKKSSSGTATRS